MPNKKVRPGAKFELVVDDLWMEKLPKELRRLVSDSVFVLGQVIRKQAGGVILNKVERIRTEMKSIRLSQDQAVTEVLSRLHQRLRRFKPEDRRQIARAFSLMLELINTCETAYRTHRLRQRGQMSSSSMPDSITYVVTAHPTEARPPQLIALFQRIQELLIKSLATGFESESSEIEHLLHLIWNLPLTRHNKPTVEDEARSVFEIVLKDTSIQGYIDLERRGVPFRFRSWVGGDKDGHPGVNANVTAKCLTLSRGKIIGFIRQLLSEVISNLETVQSAQPNERIENIAEHAKTLRAHFEQRRKVEENDGLVITQLQRSFEQYCKIYEANVGVIPQPLVSISQLFKIFPALVVPLELRESAEMFKSALGDEKAPIVQMLKRLQKISKGGQPNWYVSGVVISHTESIDDLLSVKKIERDIFRNLSVPIIPLFESENALVNSREIIGEFVTNNEFKSAISNYWGGVVEIMIGYSDSAKQSGSLPSRVMISKSIHGVSEVVEKAGYTPVFFHGSGGSVARGGGSLQDQTEWWPKPALNHLKMTVQGEMIQRSFASREILNRQMQKIADNCKSAKPVNKQSPVLQKFSKMVMQSYREKIQDENFLKMVAVATPYRFLKDLKIGSRPSKRNQDVAFENLRAIPWVLCWTQTRTLFPTWWGVGSSWRQLNDTEKNVLIAFYKKSPLFRSYVKQLGFTLEKVVLPVFRIYLERSGIDKSEVETIYTEFKKEHKSAVEFTRKISGQRDLLWFRPWLKESIGLRSSMIHPLNILQVIAIEESELDLLRESVMGIASGMMTTG